MSQPLRESDILFPSAATDFSIKKTLSALKRNNLSISNRLHSIAQDAAFVSSVADAYQLPLIANERCGSWYIHPDRKVGSAYFKSTDGHNGQWAFSLRRLNLQVIEVLANSAQGQGCIIVDSTRRGKSMPDALSKTVPIWIAVLNRLLFPELKDCHDLATPDEVVSPSEHAQIAERLDSFVTELQSLHLDAEGLRVRLKAKPLKPIWVTPDSMLPSQTPRETDCHLIVLCTASGRTSADRSSMSYVQGAADDGESWALGLDGKSFWSNSSLLLSASEDELPEIIQSICNSRADDTPREPVRIKPTACIFIANNAAAEARCEDFDIVVTCSKKPIESIAVQLKQRYINLDCTDGKLGSRKLRAELPKLETLKTLLDGRADFKVLLACQTGKDLAVGAALAAICKFSSEEGEFSASRHDVAISKAMIKHRLSWIMVSMPDAAPSRATLQSVNAYLLG